MRDNALNQSILIALVIVAVGSLFKFVHWPGANFIIIIGCGGLGILGLIKTAIGEDFQTRLYGCTTAFLAIGYLFVKMQWNHFAGKCMLGVAIAAGLASMFVGSKKEE